MVSRLRCFKAEEPETLCFMSVEKPVFLATFIEMGKLIRESAVVHER